MPRIARPTKCFCNWRLEPANMFRSVVRWYHDTAVGSIQPSRLVSNLKYNHSSHYSLIRPSPKCGRIASSSYTQTKLTREYENINHPHLQIRTKDDGKLRQSHSASSIFVVMDEALDFTKCRRVNFMAPNFNVVQNLENAQSILKTDPGNFPANQYMGWHELLLGNRSAIRYLEQSLKSGMENVQIGRIICSPLLQSHTMANLGTS